MEKILTSKPSSRQVNDDYSYQYFNLHLTVSQR